MMRWMMIIACLLAAAGCKTLQPEYPVSSVTFDERLVGAWEFVPKDDADNQEQGEEKETFRISLGAVELPVHQGRIDTRVEKDLTDKTPMIKAYTGVLTLGEKSYDIHAYLLEVRGQTLLGLQVTDEQLEKGGPGFLVAPVHLVLRADLAHGHLTLRGPREGLVGWMPNVRWLDAGGKKGEGSGTYLTNSIDRLIEFFHTHAGEEGFWDDDAAEFRHVGS